MEVLRGSVRHNLRRLVTFSGRDDPLTFWPWAGVVFVAWMVLGNLYGFASTFGVLLLGGTPDPDPVAFVVMALASFAFTVALLAASVVRRLHDRGVGVRWAVIPGLALLAALAAQAWVVLPALDGGEPAPGPFVLAFLLSAVYLAAVAALAVQLALPTRRSEGGGLRSVTDVDERGARRGRAPRSERGDGGI